MSSIPAFFRLWMCTACAPSAHPPHNTRHRDNEAPAIYLTFDPSRLVYAAPVEWVLFTCASAWDPHPPLWLLACEVGRVKPTIFGQMKKNGGWVMCMPGLETVKSRVSTGKSTGDLHAPHPSSPLSPPAISLRLHKVVTVTAGS